MHHALTWQLFNFHRAFFMVYRLIFTFYYYACNMQFHSSTSSTNAWPSAIIFHYNTSFSFSVYIYTVLHTERRGQTVGKCLDLMFLLHIGFRILKVWDRLIYFFAEWFIFSLLFPGAQISTRSTPTHVAACQEDYDRYVCKSFQQLVFLQHHFSYQSFGSLFHSYN